MRSAARAALAVLALTSAAAATAQAPEAPAPAPGPVRVVSGGFRVTLEPALALEVSVEEPLIYTPEGWRVGLVTSLRARAAPGGAAAAALAGLTATLPLDAAWAVQAQLLYRVEWDGRAEAGPELVIVFTNIR